MGSLLDKRIKYARDEVLQKEFLPHIDVKEGGETKKGYFLGYMVHRLLHSALERRPMDDRDHYGNKVCVGPFLVEMHALLVKRWGVLYSVRDLEHV